MRRPQSLLKYKNKPLLYLLVVSLVFIIIATLYFQASSNKMTSLNVLEEKSVGFGSIYHGFDYENSDFSFESMYGYLTDEYSKELKEKIDSRLPLYHSIKYKSVIHEIVPKIEEFSSKRAIVKVKIKFTEELIHQSPITSWMVVYYSFINEKGEWLIEEINPGTVEENSELNNTGL